MVRWTRNQLKAKMNQQPNFNACQCFTDDDCAAIDAADGNLCDGTFLCNDSNNCVEIPGTEVVCDDDSECTADECIMATGECVFTTIPGACPESAGLTGLRTIATAHPLASWARWGADWRCTTRWTPTAMLRFGLASAKAVDE